MSSPPASLPRHARTRFGRFAVALLPGLAFLAWFVVGSGFDREDGRWFILADDAMISMTYARTLVETGEWVWFPGAERVQGFTNPLWTLYLAALHLLGLTGSSAALAVILTGVLLVLGCAVVSGQLVHGLLAGSRWQSLATLVVVGTVPLLYPLVFWTLRGMEVGLLTFLLLLMLQAALRTLRAEDGGSSPRRALTVIAVAASIGVATRLDFLLLAGVVLGLLFWWAPARWRVVWAAVPVLLTTAVILGFQWFYYGDVLPNTYHLKMDGVNVWDRVLHGGWTLAKSAPWLILTAVALAAILHRATYRYLRRAAVLLGWVIAVTAGYHVWVGGDSWETNSFANRFLATVLPLVLVLVVTGAAAWLSAGAPGGARRALLVLGVGVVTAAGIGFIPSPDEFAPVMAAGGVFVAALVLPVAALALSLRKAPRARYAQASGLAVPVVAILLTTSAIPFALHLQQGSAQAIRGEREATTSGLALASLTDESARIAVWPAGAVAYYARRPMIDVLGKSDRRIANLPARLSVGGMYTGVTTGHDKWDLSYSLAELEPDVVYQPRSVAAILDEVRSYGYQPRCTAEGDVLYVREWSTLIDRTALHACSSAELPPPRSEP